LTEQYHSPPKVHLLLQLCHYFGALFYFSFYF
jgi:hypothetical protein